MKIRVLIVDDHAVFRTGMRAVLEREPDLDIVGEAGNGQDAIAAVAGGEVDVVLLDISMPVMTGPRVAELLLAEHKHLAIVMLTMHDDEQYLQDLFQLGVRAFVLKTSTVAELIQAIRAAYRGQQFVDAAMAQHVIASYVGRSSRKAASPDPLTPREREICRLLALGYTNPEIGKSLHISERTVETHRANMMNKLSLKSRAQLVRFAIDNGLLKTA